jgi:hypothetical protein
MNDAGRTIRAQQDKDGTRTVQERYKKNPPTTSAKVFSKVFSKVLLKMLLVVAANQRECCHGGEQI